MIPQEHYPEFIQVAVKELSEWLKWKAVRPATKDELKAADKGNIMPATGACRELGNYLRAAALCNGVI